MPRNSSIMQTILKPQKDWWIKSGLDLKRYFNWYLKINCSTFYNNLAFFNRSTKQRSKISHRIWKIDDGLFYRYEAYVPSMYSRILWFGPNNNTVTFSSFQLIGLRPSRGREESAFPCGECWHEPELQRDDLHHDEELDE